MPDEAILRIWKKELCGRGMVPIDGRSEMHASTARRADRSPRMLRGYSDL